MELHNNPLERILVSPSRKNIRVWHFVLFPPPDCPYAGGEYHGYISFPPEYPLKPPGL